MSAIIEVYAGAPFIFKNGDDDDSNNSNNSNKSSTNSDIAVFYNIFIPFNKSESELQSAYDVIKEQISQIGVGVKSPVTLFYVNIGERIDERRVSKICALYSHITCKLRQFYQAGFEDLTLAELYDHCQNRDESKVIYIHNKGSFHPKLEGGWAYIRQDVWRRMGTMAASSDMCINPPDPACDFCGLIATPIPWLHVPGNFWSARCSYVKKLLHPQDYKDAMQQYREKFAEPLVNNNTMSMRFEIRGKRCFGDERWADENWIGSHPSVVPCDVANVSDISYWQSVDRNITEFAFSRAPRRPLRFMMDKSRPRIPPFILNRPGLRLRDFHLLGGMITRWQWLYKKVPSNTSWMWSYYPDAQLWREAFEKYGEDAFRRVELGLG